MIFNDKTLTRIIVSLLVLIGLNEANAKSLDLTLSGVASRSADAQSGYEAKLTAGGDEWNLWASYGGQPQTMITQSVGDISILAVGFGYRYKPFYLDVGVAQLDGTYDDRIIREGIWFSFAPTFLPAHWLPSEDYLKPGLTYETDFDLAPLVRLGVQFDLTETLAVDLNYRLLSVNQYMNMKNPPLVQTRGYWEGSFKRSLDAISIGITWKFK